MTRSLHRAFREASSTMQWLLLLALLYSSSLRQVSGEWNETQTDGPRMEAAVSLRSVTLFKKNSWLEPSIYFRCASGNTTSLPFVKQLMRFYQASGTEDWQPLFLLEPHSCKQCAVYERGIFEDSRLGRWHLCTTNFSTLDSDEPLKLVQKGVITLNLACPQCPVEDQQVQHVEEEPESQPSQWLMVLLVVFGVAGVVMVTMTMITIIVYLRKDSSPIVFEEQSKMLEMHRAESNNESSANDINPGMPERVTSDQFEQVPLEKRHTGSVFREDRDEYI